MTKLSIIIVNFNTFSYLQKCLETLFTFNKKEFATKYFEIIIVDNASNIDPSKALKKKYPLIAFIQNKANVGFAKANNIGIKKSKGEYVLLLNPDTEVHQDTLSSLVDFLDSHQNTGVATGRVSLTDGTIDDASHRGFPTPLRALMHFSGISKIFPHSTFFNGYHLGFRNMNEVHEIEACVGAFMLVRRTVGDMVNWLDEDYFWYGEDLDFCYRVKQKGFKIMYVPFSTLIHHKGIASGIKNHSAHLSSADYQIKKMATKARFEAMRIFYKKHYYQKYPFWLTQMVMLGIFIKQKVSETQI